MKIGIKEVRIFLLLLAIISPLWLSIFMYERISRVSDFKGLKEDKIYDETLSECPFLHIKNNWSEFEKSIIAGTGSLSDPYRIKRKAFDGNDCLPGIFIENSDAYFIIEGCDFFNTTVGIGLLNVSHGIIRQNRMTQSEYGIAAARGINTITITENECMENYMAIGIAEAWDVLISKNVCSLNKIVGIMLHETENSTVFENVISDTNTEGKEGFLHISRSTGLYLYKSRGNLIWNNTFRTNSNFHAYCDESEENRWYVNNSGNFWGGYKDRYPEAKSSDGVVWDIPYEIEGTEGVYDEYPLKKGLKDAPKTLGFWLDPFTGILIILFIIIGLWVSMEDRRDRAQW